MPKDVGPERRTAYALAVIGLDVVQRSTLRALLPVGTVRAGTLEATLRKRRKLPAGSASRNRTTGKFQDILREFESWGWIERGRILVRVIDRDALHAWALNDLPGDKGEAYWLDLDRAVAEIREANARPVSRSVPAQDLAPRILVEQRRRELLALQRLMQERRGDNWSGRGSVRFVPRGRTI